MRRQVEELTRRHDSSIAWCAIFCFQRRICRGSKSACCFSTTSRPPSGSATWSTTRGLKKLYFQLQAKRMLAYEGEVCRAVRKVVAVSEGDAEAMRQEYGVKRVYAAPTGVDLDYFARPDASEKLADLVFLGSMDWMPNIDGITWFVREALPLIHAQAAGMHVCNRWEASVAGGFAPRRIG